MNGKNLLLSLLLFLFLFPTSIERAFSATPSQQNTFEATVGAYTLSIYGLASPNASINLKSNNILLSSSTAAADGTFSFVKIPITQGFTSFCLQSVDAYRLGKSEGCISVPPATADIILRNIYLPPTIGLEHEEIQVGSSGLTYGYSMPNASIDIKLNNGSKLVTTSTPTGRYSYTVGNLPIGSYDMAARGTYQGNESLEPISTVTLQVLTSSASRTNGAVGLRRLLLNLWPWLLLGALLLLALLLYLIHRFRPEWLQFFYKSRAYAYIRKHIRRKLHHAWFVGY